MLSPKRWKRSTKAHWWSRVKTPWPGCCRTRLQAGSAITSISTAAGMSWTVRASGMLAVATAAEKLASGAADFVLAGGVDVSLDPLELVGFARLGALTRGDMNVYDASRSGFIPGEGCGFVALKRLEDARADGDYVYATIRGWGISTDGKGWNSQAPRRNSGRNDPSRIFGSGSRPARLPLSKDTELVLPSGTLSNWPASSKPRRRTGPSRLAASA